MNSSAGQAGYGIRVNRTTGRVEWCDRGLCPACGCEEHGLKLTVVLEKRPASALVVEVQAPNMPYYPGNDSDLLRLDIRNGNTAANLFMVLSLMNNTGTVLSTLVVGPVNVPANFSMSGVPLMGINFASQPAGVYSLKWTAFELNRLVTSRSDTHWLWRTNSNHSRATQ